MVLFFIGQYHVFPIFGENTYTDLIELLFRIAGKFWRFLILSDADGDVSFWDESDIPLDVIVGDMLTNGEWIQVGKMQLI